MQRLLYRKMWRELRAAWPRYLALGMAITLAMYLIVSLIGAADTVILGTARHAAANGIEDGQFTTFVPLTDGEVKALTDSGIALEKAFFLDYELEGGQVLRVFRLREAIDRAELESGSLPGDDGVALEKRYCEENGLAPGDAIQIAGLALTVSGICTSPDYDTPFRDLGDSTVDSANFGTAFVTNALYERLRQTGEALRSEEYLYAYRLNGALTDDALRERLKALDFAPDSVADPWFREYWDRNYGKRDELLDAASEMADGTQRLSDALDEMGDKAFGKPGTVAWKLLPKDLTEAYDAVHEAAEGASELRDAVDELADQYMRPETGNLRSFITARDNPRIGGAADDVVINKYASIVAGVIVMALLTYVISVFVVHNIDSEQSVIGTLYALGVRRSELTRHYLLLPVMVALLAGIAGTALGYSDLGVPTQTADTYAYFSVPSLSTVVELPVVLYGAVMPPLIAALVNLLFIRRRLSAPALKLIRKETKYAQVRKLDLGRLGYVRRFQIRQLIRESRSAVGVVLAIFICLLLMMIGINAWVLCDHVGKDNVTDTRYSHMYLYKYPEAEAPAGGYEAIALTMKKEVLGYNMDVTLLGLTADNPLLRRRAAGEHEPRADQLRHGPEVRTEGRRCLYRDGRAGRSRLRIHRGRGGAIQPRVLRLHGYRKPAGAVRPAGGLLQRGLYGPGPSRRPGAALQREHPGGRGEGSRHLRGAHVVHGNHHDSRLRRHHGAGDGSDDEGHGRPRRRQHRPVQAVRLSQARAERAVPERQHAADRAGRARVDPAVQAHHGRHVPVSGFKRGLRHGPAFRALDLCRAVCGLHADLRPDPRPAGPQDSPHRAERGPEGPGVTPWPRPKTGTGTKSASIVETPAVCPP